MKKYLLMVLFVVTFFAATSVSAYALTNNTVKVGLKYGSSALFSANLENQTGSGYSFGYYDSDRSFVTLGSTGQTAISVTAAGTIYMSGTGVYSASSADSAVTIGPWHVQADAAYGSYQEAAAAASAYAGGYPAYISGAFYVRVGCYPSSADAASAAASMGISGTAVSSGNTGVLVTVTKTSTVLFEFDCQGLRNLGIQPDGQGSASVTWFKGYRYYGGFEYARITGGNINVLNVVGLEDYVRGVIPYEMSGSWPAEALKAQAVCARTYVCAQTKHLNSYGFDVCNTTDCQVYQGVGNATAVSNGAVDATAGQCLYFNGSLIGANAVYFSSDGGATEDAANVWGNGIDYLVGKKDPYEATISIPNYSYTTSYTTSQLTSILRAKGYGSKIGTVSGAYVSAFTGMGNVYKVTFTDTAGKTLTVKGETCRTIFYSSTYGKSVRSMRFTINGASGGGQTASGSYYVNGNSSTLDSLGGVSAISGSGSVGTLPDSGLYVITSSGKEAASAGSDTAAPSSSSGDITITGTGSGHNVGMSQYGAYAMAKQGMSYTDILNFYYTNVTIG